MELHDQAANSKSVVIFAQSLRPKGIDRNISPRYSPSHLAAFGIRNLKLIWLVRNWRAVLAAFSGQAPLCRLEIRNGAVIMAPTTLDLAFLFNEIWLKRTYNPRGYEVHNSEIVIDIGANIGVFSIYAATRAPGVQVYAYEPFSPNVEWLGHNIRASNLSNVRIYEMAVAATCGKRQLAINPSNWIVHTLQSEHTQEGGPAVETITLHEIIVSNKIAQCDLLKLDCEGSEYEILYACGQETLKRIRRIVGEFHGSIERAQELCRFLEMNSFKIEQFIVLAPTNGIFCARNQSLPHS